MKVKRIELSLHTIPEFFIKHKRGRTIKVIKGLPEDAKFLRAYYEANRDIYNLIFESDHFEEVPKKSVIPLFIPEFESSEVGNGN